MSPETFRPTLGICPQSRQGQTCSCSVYMLHGKHSRSPIKHDVIGKHRLTMDFSFHGREPLFSTEGS